MTLMEKLAVATDALRRHFETADDSISIDGGHTRVYFEGMAMRVLGAIIEAENNEKA